LKRLAVVLTHPIQYYSPVLKSLSKNCELKVFYTLGKSLSDLKYDHGFKKNVAWDIPLLEGYSYVFEENTSKQPGDHHFSGIKNNTLIENIASFNPDALFVYGWAYHSHLKAIRHFRGKVPIWFRGDSTLIDNQIFIKKIARKIFLYWVYSHIDIVFYPGSASKRYFKACGLKEDQLIFAPHAIDNERFSTDRHLDALEIRQNFRIKEEEILILFAGKLEPKKNPLLLLQVFKQLSRSDVHLLFVGNGILEDALKEQAVALKNRIHFMDFQNQSTMPALYQAADLYCLPSKGPGETWGLAVNEAMAAGKAVVVSDKVGSAEDLVQKQNGLIFKSEQPKELLETLNSLLEKKKLEEMGLSSKNTIENWTIEKQVSIIIESLNAE
jgi:glycosyltransferase involved in cell wall biosynthesis